jgi:hypothetical protein
MVQARPVGKVVVNGLFNETASTITLRQTFQVDNQLDRFVDGKFLSPAHNEILRAPVKIPIWEGRRVNGVKELIDVPKI